MRGFCAVLACAVVLIGHPAYALDWNSNEVAYWYGSQFREPGVSKDGAARDIPKNILTLSHADGYSFGQNFINIDILKSSSADPQSTSGDGATEVYVVDRQDFSLNKLFGTSAFTAGPIKDVTIEAGIDINTKNTAFTPYKRMPVAGMAALFDVPGFLKVAALWDKEWNHNGIADQNVTFNSTARVETSWEIPFALSAAHFTFEGFGIYNAPKGKDGFNAETRVEVLLHSQIMLDVGTWFDHPKILKAGLGYQYWFNKFGADHSATQGALEAAPFLRISSSFEF